MPVVATGVHGTTTTTDGTTAVAIAANIDIPNGKMCIGDIMLAGIDQNNLTCMIGFRFGGKKVGGVNSVVGSTNVGTIIDGGLAAALVTASVDSGTGLIRINVIGVAGSTIDWIAHGTVYMLS